MITLLFHHLDDEILIIKGFLIMFSFGIVLLGLALAMDAAVVAFTVGLVHLELTAGGKLRRGFLISLTFGLFQTGMLWLGSYAGFLFTYSRHGFYFKIAVAIIFLGLAIKFIQESVTLEKKKIEWGILPVIILAFATSIDALAAGIGLATLPRPYFAAAEVGLITFAMCGMFYFISQFFRQIPDRWLLRLAAFIFLFLSGQVFWDLKDSLF
jgi:putative Mn2+ efflux pump MntP